MPNAFHDYEVHNCATTKTYLYFSISFFIFWQQIYKENYTNKKILAILIISIQNKWWRHQKIPVFENFRENPHSLIPQ